MGTTVNIGKGKTPQNEKKSLTRGASDSGDGTRHVYRPHTEKISPSEKVDECELGFNVHHTEVPKVDDFEVCYSYRDLISGELVHRRLVLS